MSLILLDFNRTLYDPETEGLVPGATSLLDALKKRGDTLVLVSRLEAGREDVLRELGIGPYFSDTVFTKEKTPELFVDIITRHRFRPEHAYVVGDHLHQEIRHGNRAGARTIHFKRGIFAGLKKEHRWDEPWRTVTELSEVAGLLE